MTTKMIKVLTDLANFLKNNRIYFEITDKNGEAVFDRMSIVEFREDFNEDAPAIEIGCGNYFRSEEFYEAIKKAEANDFLSDSEKAAKIELAAAIEDIERATNRLKLASQKVNNQIT